MKSGSTIRVNPKREENFRLLKILNIEYNKYTVADL